MTPPIRFLASAIGSWIFLRGAMLVPWQAEDFGRAPEAAPRFAAKPARPGTLDVLQAKREFPVATAQRPLPFSARTSRPSSPRVRIVRSGLHAPQRSAAWLRPHRLGWSLSPSPARLRPAPGGWAAQTFARRLALPSEPSRWTASAWLHGRGGEASALAPGGQLGGSQAGTRIGYRPSPALLLTGRLSAPLRGAGGAEGAVGVEWQPASSLPLRLLAERRQRLGREGRSAWAATLYGGVGEVPLPAGFRLEAYGQAGAVGARSRDLFAEGSAKVSAPLSSGLSLGAGIWGAAQPGASRLDIGPSLNLRLPQMRASLSADWRFRAAGGAQPGSGPALTLWTDF
jgi:hypothetical protein